MACYPRSFWFDLENITCLTFFEPIVRELTRRGHRVAVTYRECPHIAGLLAIHAVRAQQIGRSGGKHVLRKVQKGLLRAVSLFSWGRQRQFDVAIGFGARPLALCCRLLRLPNASVIDYEHVSLAALKAFCDWIFVPADVRADFWESKAVPPRKLVKFEGLKEQVYVPNHRLDPGLRTRLEVGPERTFVLIRPPAHLAHYHDERSEAILRRVLERVAAESAAIALVIPRTADRHIGTPQNGSNIRDLKAPLNGLDLIAAADLVVSGGGTMIREAAALGVPAYSIFTGPIGAIDARLAREGKLVLVRTPEEVERIVLEQRSRKPGAGPECTSNLNFFVEAFTQLASFRTAAVLEPSAPRAQVSV